MMRQPPRNRRWPSLGDSNEAEKEPDYDCICDRGCLRGHLRRLAALYETRDARAVTRDACRTGTVWLTGHLSGCSTAQTIIGPPSRRRCRHARVKLQ